MGQSRGSRSPIVSTSSAPSMAVLRPHAFRIGIPLSATEQCSRIPNLHLRTIPPKQERMLNRRRSCAPVRPRPFRSCPPIILENGGCARNQLIQRMLRFSSFFIPSQIKELCKYLFFCISKTKELRRHEMAEAMARHPHSLQAAHPRALAFGDLGDHKPQATQGASAPPQVAQVVASCWRLFRYGRCEWSGPWRPPQ